jgi:hypothetical protein
MDDLTLNQGYPRPDPQRSAAVDTDRIRAALDMIDAHIAAVMRAATYEVIGLVLLGKADDIAAGNPQVVPTANEIRDYVTRAVSNRIDELIGSKEGVLTTLEELSKAIGNDPEFAQTIMSEIGKKADKTDLDFKADKTAVAQSVSLINQAIAATNNAVATKADQDYVYNSIVNLNNSKLNNSGDLTAASNVFRLNSTGYEPRIVLWKANVRHQGIMLTNEGDLVLIDLDTSTVTHRFTATGQIWCIHYGWLHNHINDRAWAYAENAKAWVNENFVSQIRFTGGGETGYRPGWVGGNSGEVITAQSWSTNSVSRGIDAVRTKYAQRYVPAVGWITTWTD